MTAESRPQLLETPKSDQELAWEKLEAALKKEGIGYATDIQKDDAGKEVETVCNIGVSSIEKAERVVALAKENDFGVMPVGALTSATGAFEAESAGEVHSLNGWVGLRLSAGGKVEKELKPGDEIEIEGNRFEAVPLLDGQAILFKSKNPSIVSHRIRCWGALTPDDLDKALCEALGDGHTIGLDLTTRNQAKIAAVIATGGQGPSRRSPREGLKAVTIVDGHGRRHELRGEDAKKQVGLEGIAGAIMEAEFEVLRHEPDDFGLFIPIPGGQKEGFTEKLPKIMAALARFSEGKEVTDEKDEKDEKGKKITAALGELHVQGFELITRRDLTKFHAAYGRELPEATGHAGDIIEVMKTSGCEAGLLINGKTGLTKTQIFRLFSVFDEASEKEEGVSPEEGLLLRAIKELMAEGLVHSDLAGMKVFSGTSEIKEMRDMREGVPMVARKSKEEGPTSSTDLNLRIESADPAVIEAAYAEIWKIYWHYIENNRRNDADVYIYGHAHPAGVDVHVRVTFPLDNEDKQKRAPEHVLEMEKGKQELYCSLLSLNGRHGITAEPGEKGLLRNGRYLRDLEENKPDKAQELMAYIQKYGNRTFGLRSEKLQFHAYPPRLPQGLLNFFAPDEKQGSPILLEKYSESILRWCQHSHRSPEGKKVFGELFGLLRAWLNLGFDERVYFTESPEKAVHSAVLGLTDFNAGERVYDLRRGGAPEDTNAATIITENIRDLEDPRFANCRKILIREDDEPVGSEVRQKADAIVYNAETFGTGGEMGILVTKLSAVKRARDLKISGNNTDYVHSLVEMEENPYSSVETPKMQVMAELGLLMAYRAGQRCTLSDELKEKKLEEQRRFLTFNPGPSQLNRRVIEQNIDLTQRARRMRTTLQEAREATAEVKQKLKRFLGIPEDYEIFFTGSATQAMQQIVESLNLDQSVVLRKGAFGDRLLKVVRQFSPEKSEVSPVSMRWAESENSQLEAIAREIKGKKSPIPKRNTTMGLFMTGHETATGAEMDVKALAGRIDRSFLTIVDGTSEAGAVQRDFKDIDVYFGSCQKFMGVPSGLGFIAVSPRAMTVSREAAAKRDTKTPAYRTFPEMKNEEATGEVFHDLRGMLQLGAAMDDYLERGGLQGLALETRQKLGRILQVVAMNPHLDHVVGDKRDRSRVMPHIVAKDISVRELRRRLKKLGVIGGGYGPYSKETLRIYLGPNVTDEQVEEMAAALDAAARACEVITEKRPLVSRAFQKQAA